MLIVLFVDETEYTVLFTSEWYVEYLCFLDKLILW